LLPYCLNLSHSQPHFKLPGQNGRDAMETILARAVFLFAPTNLPCGASMISFSPRALHENIHLISTT
jgi:hypothetical protein